MLYSEKGSTSFAGLLRGSKAQKTLGPQNTAISKDLLFSDILGFHVSVSRGPEHQHNYEIKFADHIAFFFPIRKYIQASAALPNSWASHRMRSNDTGNVSKNPVLPASPL